MSKRSDGTTAVPRLLTLQSASQASGIPTNSLRDLVSRGHLPVVRLPGNRRVFVLADDLAALVLRSRGREEVKWPADVMPRPAGQGEERRGRNVVHPMRVEMDVTTRIGRADRVAHR